VRCNTPRKRQLTVHPDKEITMSHSLRSLYARAVLVGVGLGLMSVAGAADKASYETTKKQASAQYEADRAACKPMKGNAQDICMAEAKAKERIAVAEARAAYENNDKARRKATEDKADALYNVAKEKCDDMKGNEKDVCMKQAKADRDKVKATAEARKEVAAANKEAAKTSREADYKVAREKCDSMSGADKDACIAQAKARFGK
jgi:hypothetical protein